MLLRRSLLRLSLWIVVLSLALFLSIPEVIAQEIVILHTNDIHGRIEEDRFDGMGLARMAFLIENYRSKYDHVLLLDGGDTIHGKPIVNLLDGRVVVEMMNVMGYDAMVAGNHDFNYGYEHLLEISESMYFPLLAANVYKGGETLFEPYTIVEVGDKRVGIFGLATPETTFKTHPNNVIGLEFGDIVVAAEKMVKELKDQGVDMIIALAHLGLEGEYTSTLVANEVDGIHLIVDGHSHHFLEEGLWVRDTLIVQAEEYTKNLGVVFANFSDDEVSLEAHLVTKEEAADVPEDELVLSLLDAAREEILPILQEVVGSATVALDGEREDVRFKETNLGNLVADSMRMVANAQIAVNNGGGIRASIPQGEITVEQVIGVLPFGNSVVSKRVKGESILSILEKGVSYFPEAGGGFLQVSGITFSFDASKEVGSRVQDVMVGGEALALEEYYVVSTNNFLAAGGDEYYMFEGTETVGEFDLQDEVLAAYIREHGAVSPEVEGRITVLHTVSAGESLEELASLYHVDSQKLASENGLSLADCLNAGQTLRIPVN